MKPTRRRNGRHMVTVRIEHSLDGEEVASVLAAVLVGEGDLDGSWWDKASIMTSVKEWLGTNGEGDVPYIAERMGLDAWSVMWEAAARRVRHAFPEWLDEVSEQVP